jgi:hypothetical protein
MSKKKNAKQPPEPFWQEIVAEYFRFCKEKFHDIPSFDGSSPRDLKSIVSILRKRCESAGEEWTYEAATGRFRHFLEYAYGSSPWLRDNWLLSNLNRQKDSIFFNKSKNEGTK